jgi:hypothetical protein
MRREHFADFSALRFLQRHAELDAFLYLRQLQITPAQQGKLGFEIRIDFLRIPRRTIAVEHSRNTGARETGDGVDHFLEISLHQVGDGDPGPGLLR